MKLTNLIVEMGAAKLCDKCGKSMAANHYWYKGGWKCKGPKPEQTPAEPQQPGQDSVQQPAPVVKPTPAETKTDIGSQPVARREPEPVQQTPVAAQPLSIEVDIIAEAMPELEAELKKINKVAAKVGSPAITTEIIKTEFRDISKKIRDHDTDTGTREVRIKQKFITVKLTGNTPRLRGNDGTMWNFVGVITPSAQGRAMLKLTPSAEDTEGIRQMYTANPYYCDHCKKVRQRNETFIVQNGTTYRQVGRNCLKDFVGGADPQALLNYFAWFQTADDLNRRFAASSGGDDDGGYGGGGGMRGQHYVSIESALATTLAVISVRGSYVSSKAETGTPTSSDVRFAFWGRFNSYTSKEEVAAMTEIRRLMETDDIKAKAKEIIDWFNALPESEINANTFYQNVKVMVDEDAVSQRMLGYIVGLYPAYQRAQQQNAETAGGVRLIKEWPAEWGDDPRPITGENATVKFVKNIQGAYGVSQLIMMMLDNGIGVTWKYSGQNKVNIGDEFKITGELQKDTYRDPATIRFVPSRKWLRSAFKDE